MQVYMRHSDNADSQHFADVASPDDFTKLLSPIKQTGVYAEGQKFGERDSFDVQIVVDEEDGAYIEVIVG